MPQRIADGDLAPLVPLQIFRHPLHFELHLLALGVFPARAVVDVEEPLAHVIGVQFRPDGDSIRLVLPYLAGAAALEGPPVRKHKLRHQPPHPLHHQDEAVALPVEEADVFAAEASPVQDEADVPVAVSVRLLQHVLELGHVDYASGVLLVEQGLPAHEVVPERIVEDGKTGVVLRLAELGHGEVPGLAVLVGGVVGDVDPLPVVPPPVPGVQEAGALVVGDGAEELRHLAVGVHPHTLGEERMVVGVVGIVLGRVVLADQGIGRKVQEQPEVDGAEEFAEHRRKRIVVQQLPDQEVAAHAEAAAAERAGLLAWQVHAGKVSAVVLVRQHQAVLRELADAGAHGDGVALLGVVSLAVLVVDVGRAGLRLADDAPGTVGDLSGNGQVHYDSPCCVCVFSDK